MYKLTMQLLDGSFVDTFCWLSEQKVKEELNRYPRQVYCWALFYVDQSGHEQLKDVGKPGMPDPIISDELKLRRRKFRKVGVSNNDH